ncbi:hypothetical protein EPI10_001758 [Gossypium australe]|uniref:Uncharacterized protein n=1 Tax=Gossypium australe TaxID=47621 RepID=A0A5B6VCG4_9ROSI|nr:hypothetical protein EPI10_001758 [Gossypium australe]
MSRIEHMDRDTGVVLQYQSLFDAHVVSPFYLKLMQPPFPKWYDANAQCKYHAGITGHSIGNCTAFKMLIQRFIKMGIVKFDDPSGHNVVGNTLPSHSDQGVNTIIESGGKRTKIGLEEVKTPLKWVWKKMIDGGVIMQNLEEKPKGMRIYCEFHAEEGHEIQECTEFRALVQSLIDNNELEFFEYTKGSEGEDKPVASPCKDSKRVPWNYACNVMIPGENLVSTLEEGQDMGFYTHSGRRYAPANTRTETVKGKALAVEHKKKKTARLESPVNEPVTEKEAKEFLKFLKHSEYSVVEQLHKQPARISVLALLLSSETHRSALMKVLNETYVTDDISVNKLEWVLIDNGSTLNVLPLFRLNKLPVDASHMKTCQNIVRAFNGTKRRVMRRIEIPLLIGPDTYEIDFLLMDIKPSYNCLLGRPWIHSAMAVSSSLRQKQKLVTEGRLVTINAKEDIITSVSSDAPYIGSDDEAIECSF